MQNFLDHDLAIVAVAAEKRTRIGLARLLGARRHGLFHDAEQWCGVLDRIDRFQPVAALRQFEKMCPPSQIKHLQKVVGGSFRHAQSAVVATMVCDFVRSGRAGTILKDAQAAGKTCRGTAVAR